MQYFILSITVFFCPVLFGQIELLNNSLTHPGENIAYSDYVNELEIKGINVDSTTVIQRGSGRLYRVDNTFFYSPGDSPEYDTLKIFTDGNQAAAIIMKIESLDPPKVYLGELRAPIVTREYLLSNPGLQLSYEPQLAIPYFYVSACEMMLIKNGKTSVDTIYGNAFSDKQLRRLGKLKAGDVIWFGKATISDFMGKNETVDINLKLILSD